MQLQLIVSVLQQLFEVWHVRWAEAASLAAAEKCFGTVLIRGWLCKNSADSARPEINIS